MATWQSTTELKSWIQRTSMILRLDWRILIIILVPVKLAAANFILYTTLTLFSVRTYNLDGWWLVLFCFVYVFRLRYWLRFRLFPADIGLVKINNGSNILMWKTCLKLTMKMLERCRSFAFVVNFKHISHIFLVFLLLTHYWLISIAKYRLCKTRLYLQVLHYSSMNTITEFFFSVKY